MARPLKDAVPTWSDIVSVITRSDGTDVRIKTINLGETDEHVVFKAELYTVRVVLAAYCRAIVGGTRHNKSIVVNEVCRALTDVNLTARIVKRADNHIIVNIGSAGRVSPRRWSRAFEKYPSGNAAVAFDAVK